MRNNIKGVKKKRSQNKLHLRLIPTYAHICTYIQAAPYNIVQKKHNIFIVKT